MQGFPKTLNTKQDYLNCLQDFPKETKNALQLLLEDRFIWTQTKVLLCAEDGLTDETHKVTEADNEYFQLELIEDNNSRMLRLGFSVEEIEDLLK